jgi:hypothetical protein
MSPWPPQHGHQATYAGEGGDDEGEPANVIQGNLEALWGHPPILF